MLSVLGLQKLVKLGGKESLVRLKEEQDKISVVVATTLLILSRMMMIDDDHAESNSLE